MLHLLERLPPELWVAYGRARAARAAAGAWPALAGLRRLAEEEDACPWALAVLTTGQLPRLSYADRRLTGELVSVLDRDVAWGERPLVLAPTPDALLALQLVLPWVYAHVVDPWAREVPPRELDRAAGDWAEAVHRARRRRDEHLAPLRYESDHLLPPAEGRH